LLCILRPTPTIPFAHIEGGESYAHAQANRARARGGSHSAGIGDANDGIYDSTATPRDAVGYNFPATGGGLLIKLTLRGDANLDGAVDFNDLVTLAQHYNTTNQYWDTGDFNYDQSVDFNDLVAIAQNYNSTFAPAAPIPGAPIGFDDDLARAFASVPEPSTLATIAACGLAGMSRHRHRRHH
jgi:hypothetical protein